MSAQMEDRGSFVGRLKQLIAAATPGPWESHEGEDYVVVMSADQTTDTALARVDTIGNAALIAYLANHASAIAAVVSAAEDVSQQLMGCAGQPEAMHPLRTALAQLKERSDQ